MAGGRLLEGGSLPPIPQNGFQSSLEYVDVVLAVVFAAACQLAKLPHMLGCPARVLLCAPFIPQLWEERRRVCLHQLGLCPSFDVLS